MQEKDIVTQRLLKEDFRLKLYTTIGLGLFFYILSAPDWTTKEVVGISLPVPTWKEIKNLILSFIGSLFSSVIIIELLRFVYSWEKYVDKSIHQEFQSFTTELNRFKHHIDERMGSIIEFAALGTDHKHFETALNKLRNGNLGKVRWLISKFISFKLNKDFHSPTEVKIENMDIGEYSDFLEDLIWECEKSIYLTCPWSPESWFKDLKINDANTKSIDLNLFPKHFKAFLDSPVSDKKRVSNLQNDQWEELINKSNKLCFDNFVQGQDRYQLRFAKMKDIKNKYPQAIEGDYNIFDNTVVVRWEPYRGKDTDCNHNKCINFKRCNKSECIIGVCTLIFQLYQYNIVFEHVEDKTIYKDVEEIGRILNSV